MKFYVNAGVVKGIIDVKDEDPRTAAKLVLRKFATGKVPALYTYVSERGFFMENGVERKDFIFVTDSLMNEIQ